MSALTTFLMGHFMRWFPHRAETGLRAVGHPDENSPVLVSCNYTLSVARLVRELEGLDVWVLVAQSSGINVWCAACGGEFTDHQVISAVKTSRLSEKVRHRRLILPALCAPGMDVKNIRDKTGFRARFGPAEASDIRAYLDAGMKKLEGMQRKDFGIGHRMDMLVSMNFVWWAPVAAAFAIFWPEHLFHFSVLFWGTALGVYVLFPWVPGRRGWTKAFIVTLVLVAGYVGAGRIVHDDPFFYWPWIVGAALLTAMIGMDLGGTAGPVPSDAEEALHRMGVKSMGSFMKEKAIGRVTLDREACTGCFTCNGVCPIGVFGRDPVVRKTRLARRGDCFSCGACVKQCPERALRLAS
ncbi:MAG: 4Fe-4S dicluster domain-containing protein [Deltaproteobacteria bacterium]|nr:4Fe-4S dicluster domain-containing protein [Deltaproteobacteria bacterium]